MRTFSTAVCRGTTLLTLLLILAAPAAYADDPVPTDPQARIRPPIGLTSQEARISPPVDARSGRGAFTR
jgi:hypothetical protein